MVATEAVTIEYRITLGALSHGSGVVTQTPRPGLASITRREGTNVNTAPTEEYEDQPMGWWAKIKSSFHRDHYDDYEEEYEEPVASRGETVRLHSARCNRVSVWLNVTSLDHAQNAADGLKNGHQQIINLEQASLEVSARVIDFLSGVIYALNGNVQKIGDKVYMFTPASYLIEVEDGNTSRKVNSPFAQN